MIPVRFVCLELSIYLILSKLLTDITSSNYPNHLRLTTKLRVIGKRKLNALC